MLLTGPSLPGAVLQMRKREEDVYERLCKVTGGRLESTAQDLLDGGKGSSRRCSICCTDKSIILMSPCRHLACADCWEVRCHKPPRGE